MKIKYIAVLFCMLLIGTALYPIPISGNVLFERTLKTKFTGNTFYVGGNGPNNYTTIQSAIDNAVDGDTVFVYDDSSPYKENVVVDKVIRLIGENKNTTIIDGNTTNCTIGLFANGIFIQEFTIQHNKEIEEEYMNILYVCSNDNTISNIIFICKPFRYETSIMLFNSSRNEISQNIIKNNYYIGIELRNSHYNEISKNFITGISIKRGHGIQLLDSSNNIIKRNEIKLNSCCVNLNELSNRSTNNQIIQNNFFLYYSRMSGVYFYIDYYHLKGNRGNTFDENYWNRPRFSPKYVLGWISLFLIPIGNYGYMFRIILPKFDLHPAQEPYDIMK
jgi:parallel beta-helix repeat protein